MEEKYDDAEGRKLYDEAVKSGKLEGSMHDPPKGGDSDISFLASGEAESPASGE